MVKNMVMEFTLMLMEINTKDNEVGEKNKEWGP